MLQAMNTGHDGSLTTVHANTPRDALSRIETMIAMGATNLPERAMRQQIAAAIQIVMQQSRMSDGTRKVTSISEITGMEGDVITMQEIFLLREARSRPGRQGHRPVPRDRRASEGVRALKAAGIHLPPDMFEGVTEVPVDGLHSRLSVFVSAPAGARRYMRHQAARSPAAAEADTGSRI
jgi:pilus assembly protein CpaF